VSHPLHVDRGRDAIHPASAGQRQHAHARHRAPRSAAAATSPRRVYPQPEPFGSRSRSSQARAPSAPVRAEPKPSSVIHHRDRHEPRVDRSRRVDELTPFDPDSVSSSPCQTGSRIQAPRQPLLMHYRRHRFSPARALPPSVAASRLRPSADVFPGPASPRQVFGSIQIRKILDKDLENAYEIKKRMRKMDSHFRIQQIWIKHKIVQG
jgi:hypothetical protein